MPRQRVGVEAILHQGEQAVEAETHVHGVAAIPQLDRGGDAQHDGAARASSRDRTKERSQPGARRKTAPVGRTTSTAAVAWRRTGTKRGSSAPAPGAAGSV